MRGDIENRCVSLAKYIVRTGATVRQAAGEFGISKSSVHKDMHERLRQIHPGLYAEVRTLSSSVSFSTLTGADLQTDSPVLHPGQG